MLFKLKNDDSLWWLIRRLNNVVSTAFVTQHRVRWENHYSKNVMIWKDMVMSSLKVICCNLNKKTMKPQNTPVRTASQHLIQVHPNYKPRVLLLHQPAWSQFKSKNILAYNISHFKFVFQTSNKFTHTQSLWLMVLK